MRQMLHRTMWLSALVVGLCFAGAAHAQYVTVYSPPRVIVPAPVVTYYQPTTSYYAPTTSYYAPTTSYYAAPVTSYYAAPVTSYYAAPVTSYYAAPVTYAAPATYSYYPSTTVYSAPAAIASPGYVATTRSYFGLGVFRPFGYHTNTYVAPATVITPATSYYAPVIIR